VSKNAGRVVGSADERPDMPPSVVMLVRHAEKPLGDGPPHGVTGDGQPDPESLTPRGWQRAGALVALFVPDESAASRSKLPTPTHLFASQVGQRSSSQRPRQTLLPLAERLGLPVDSSFRKDQVSDLVRAVRSIDGVVLIAWEHHLIPAIANLLAGDPSHVPQTWPDERYDLVWVFESAGPRPETGTRFRQVPQMLLAGDRPTPIGTREPT
jgi:broad specificity phosphatase PhoE